MYFNYYLNASTTDDMEVYISNDGATWTKLGGSKNANNNLGTGWFQYSASLAGFAGDSNLQLRFDFSTATGDMGTGDTYVTANPNNTKNNEGYLGGSYLTTVPGNQLQNGDPTNIEDYISVLGENAADATDIGGNFIFQMGAVLDVPDGAPA